MITTSTTIAKISAALATAHAKIGGAKKEGFNPHFKAAFADLNSVISASKTALNESGVFVTQSPGCLIEGVLRITTRLIHNSGEWIETACDIPLQKRDAQGVGSAVTYGRRYALMAALNIPATDDDGQEAVQPEPVAPPKPEVKRQSKENSRDLFKDIQALLESSTTVEEIDDAWAMTKEDHAGKLPEDWANDIKNQYEECRAALKEKEA